MKSHSVFLLLRLAGQIAESFLDGLPGGLQAFPVQLHISFNDVVQQLGAVQQSHLRSVGSLLDQLDGLLHAADADVVDEPEHVVDHRTVLGILGDLLQGGDQGIRHEPQLLDQLSVDSVQARLVLVDVVVVDVVVFVLVVAAVCGLTISPR